MEARMVFLKSAVKPADFPPADMPEVAVVGRSNSGKSTFINALSQSSVARVSRTPGKTRLLNFFTYGKYRWVDMPGYGYAARTAQEQGLWKEMIEDYLRERENLKGLVLLMDIRRDWQEEESMLLGWTEFFNCGIVVGLTKADKLSRSARKQRRDHIARETGLSQIFLLSSLEKSGYQELEEYVFSNWIKASPDRIKVLPAKDEGG